MLINCVGMIRRYGSDTSGNIGVIFGVSISALLVVVGAALDYSSAAKKQQRYQDLADSSVLTAAAAVETDVEKLQLVVEQAVQAQTDEAVTVSLEHFGDADENLRVTLTGEHPLMLMQMMGHEPTKIKAVAESKRANSGVNINLALVLDTTRSMQGTRMSSLKEASENLLTFLEDAAATPEAVKVSVVPFSDYVRISTSYETASWIELQDGGPVTWEELDEENSTGCVTTGTGESAQTSCDVEVMIERSMTFDWQGCMVSRPNDYHKVPAFDSRRLQGSKHSNHCNYTYNQLVPMSTDLEAANEAIQSFTPVGKTYIPAGLIWGWRTLDKNLPFDELASEEETDVRDIMLIMTDGQNSVSLSGLKEGFDGINHWGSSDDAVNKTNANALTETLCADIKEDGIEIISIAYEVTDIDTINMLSTCASSGSLFYDVQNASELGSAFTEIGRNIGTGDIRLTR